MFGKDRLPTLLQYDPNVRFIQVTEEGTILLTALDAAPEEKNEEDDAMRQMAEEAAREVENETGSWPSGTAMIQTLAKTTRESSFSTPGHETSDGFLLSGPPPLLRYHIGDSGGIKSFEEMLSTLKEHGFNPLDDPRVQDLEARGVLRKMPFAWVFGRAHWCVSLYGANVFVDQVMVGMEQAEIAPNVTGKFVLSVEDDEDKNPRVALDVELSAHLWQSEDKIRSKVASVVKQQLLRLNSEYCNYVPAHSQEPIVHLYKHGDTVMFPPGVKHKW
eukprot:CAMPEP_0184322920 /NCGR_PEP_ID=MMETSP1049-20130417/127399_1 /TAXON_ID=77928 /ORGANISM="Proteomonas sulcata, Strain CCMP704" /LENGTH=273 /DNA_ID=CAMNT_0026644239 /DNA_START=52 /DNA_END=870 /DNA_ORIENTATION=+